VVLSVLFFDKVKLDDPVGATSVHLVCGVFGTICVGLFAQDHFTPNTTGNGLLFGGGAKLLMAQLAGIVGVGVFVFVVSMVFWKIIDAFLGMRVSAEEEMEGLDIGEHGNIAYPDFVTKSS
jgi:ammonium transporter, Amt family